MAVVEQEKKAVLAAFDEVEELEDIAESLPPDQATQSDRLASLAQRKVASVPPMRLVVAAKLLRLSVPTIRDWMKDGVLREAPASGSVARLDPVSVHEVLHVVNELRAHGQKRDLVDAVWRRLQDHALLDRDDLKQSLDQLRTGNTLVLRPRK